jgi:hypothetical protein
MNTPHPLKYIGGFIELEAGTGPVSTGFHPEAMHFQNGRSGFHFILHHVRPAKVHIPFYCCNALIEPLERMGISYSFYATNDQLAPESKIILGKDEYVVYVNYFGICSGRLQKLYELYGNKLILDNTQAFFEPSFKDCFSFNSARKFFGVPDGCYVYPRFDTVRYALLPENNEASMEHLALRRNGKQKEAYEAFIRYELSLTCEEKKMSQCSKDLLARIDYGQVKQARKINFDSYHKVLKGINRFSFEPESLGTPMYYPLLLPGAVDRAQLANLGIFIPVLWKDVMDRKGTGFEWERSLSGQLLPLPIDHRYGEEDCERVVEAINRGMNHITE